MTTGEGSSAKRQRYWGLAALLIAVGVLGGLISENVMKTKDKVPLLGDLPIAGRFFRSESAITKKKNLLIFVTPTIIDPAGNRVHNDEDLPFAQSTVPVQRAVTPPPVPPTP